MKNKLQFNYIVVLSLSSFIGFIMIGLLFSNRKAIEVDHRITQLIQGFESPPLTAIMKFITFIGSTSVVAILSIFVLFTLYKVLHHRRELVFFIVVLTGNAIFNQVLKLLFHRSRPSLHQLIMVTGYSFPSGHSMSAFAMYGAITFLVWRHIPTQLGRFILLLVSCIMILSIGISRVYLGVHYPSDIIGAYLASGFWLAASIWFYQWYQERHYSVSRIN